MHSHAFSRLSIAKWCLHRACSPKELWHEHKRLEQDYGWHSWDFQGAGKCVSHCTTRTLWYPKKVKILTNDSFFIWDTTIYRLSLLEMYFIAIIFFLLKGITLGKQNRRIKLFDSRVLHFFLGTLLHNIQSFINIYFKPRTANLTSLWMKSYTIHLNLTSQVIFCYNQHIYNILKNITTSNLLWCEIKIYNTL